MAQATAECFQKLTVTDNSGSVMVISQDVTYNLGTGNAADDREYTISNAVFQALTVPTGAKAVRIQVGAAVSLTLKGVTGDTGITIAPASAPAGIDITLPLGATPSIGILNGGAGPITLRATFT